MNKQTIQIQYQGKTYSSLAGFARHFGLNREMVSSRWNRGIRDPQKLSEPSKGNNSQKVIFDGKTYPSISEFARSMATDELSAVAIKTRWSKGIRNKEELLKPAIKHSIVSIDYKGKHYTTLREFANDINLPYGTIKQRWTNGIRDPDKLKQDKIDTTKNLKEINQNSIDFKNKLLSERNLLSAEMASEITGISQKAIQNAINDIKRNQGTNLGFDASDIQDVNFSKSEVKNGINHAMLPKYAVNYQLLK